RPAGVDVEALPEVPKAHRRALDVPARVAVAPGARPPHQAPGAGSPPEREVVVVALLGVDAFDAVPGRELGHRVVGQPPVGRERVDVVVHYPGDLVGMAAADEG